MRRYEIFFSRRTSKVIKADSFYEEGNLVKFRDQYNFLVFVVSVFNFDYIEVLND